MCKQLQYLECPLGAAPKKSKISINTCSNILLFTAGQTRLQPGSKTSFSQRRLFLESLSVRRLFL